MQGNLQEMCGCVRVCAFACKCGVLCVHILCIYTCLHVFMCVSSHACTYMKVKSLTCMLYFSAYKNPDL